MESKFLLFHNSYGYLDLDYVKQKVDLLDLEYSDFYSLAAVDFNHNFP